MKKISGTGYSNFAYAVTEDSEKVINFAYITLTNDYKRTLCDKDIIRLPANRSAFEKYQNKIKPLLDESKDFSIYCCNIDILMDFIAAIYPDLVDLAIKNWIKT